MLHGRFYVLCVALLTNVFAWQDSNELQTAAGKLQTAAMQTGMRISHAQLATRKPLNVMAAA